MKLRLDHENYSGSFAPTCDFPFEPPSLLRSSVRRQKSVSEKRRHQLLQKRNALSTGLSPHPAPAISSTSPSESSDVDEQTGVDYS
ncbi:unnamed protein product [Protopolystoma xenopodis]|uniref:Uncharacterized protein n=1 Tax=Protopolystoma xenopodis TaxID=117903 RepID=A0A3S5AD66_9PLAT|nr:unnamed protein product [Protopolystoma xenopodis]